MGIIFIVASIYAIKYFFQAKGIYNKMSMLNTMDIETFRNVDTWHFTP